MLAAIEIRAARYHPQEVSYGFPKGLSGYNAVGIAGQFDLSISNRQVLLSDGERSP
jgi:hypothetical protein